MKKIMHWVLEHQKSVLAFFVASSVICLILSNFVNVNYDMMDYLPEDSPSTTALDVMGEEFDGGIPNVRAMVPNLTVPQALEMKQKLKSIEGVTDVTWLDDAVDINQPMEMLDSEEVESYYKDNNALFTITVDDEYALTAVDAIKDCIGEEGALEGSAVNTAVATSTTGDEIRKIVMFVIPLVFIILLLTTDSWFEPVLFMLTIGIAIALNKGTDIIFGEISFVTNAAGSILQLAVSMDYSIFLLHRFSEFRKQGLDVKEAMLEAVDKSVVSIASSGLTTVIGFAALILMRFGIGRDMGLVLAKGIMFSLISVLILLPVLAVICYKLIDKTTHRSFIPSFVKFGVGVSKVKLPMLIIFLVVLVPSYLAQRNNDFYYGSSQTFDRQTTEVGRDIEKIENIFGKSNNMVLLVPRGDTASEVALCNDLNNVDEVTSIISYVEVAGAEIPTEYLDEDTLAKLESDNYSRIVLSLNADYEGKESFALVEEIRKLANKYYPDTYLLAGESVNTYDLKEVVTEDTVRVNAIAIIAILLILVVTFRSIFLPIILVLVIETAIWINLSIPYFMGSNVFYIAYLIISSIQLGATVDYAILLTNNYMSSRNEFEKKEAIVDTLSKTAVSVLTSASILTLAGMVLGKICTNRIIGQLGTLIGRGSILSTILVLFVLPAMLYYFDFIFERKNKKVQLRKEEK